jgi:hypothetical protein
MEVDETKDIDDEFLDESGNVFWSKITWPSTVLTK